MPFRDRSTSPNNKLRYVNARRRDSRSASPRKDIRSASPRHTRPICAETSSSSTGMSYDSSLGAHAVKPKDFRVPLTCFFWYHTGSCKKSDNKCL
ncbi:hypothetical protein E4T52_06933 [Aureobasidium sp. EXF-3400]|nr:hypothetical protein E4T51_00150 [Aureobasidium sp. EXF-12344]KAI4778158.1 hypothetical protein E4T52_06933 [Aureobasidium sp. EXF-3400]